MRAWPGRAGEFVGNWGADPVCGGLCGVRSGHVSIYVALQQWLWLSPPRSAPAADRSTPAGSWRSGCSPTPGTGTGTGTEVSATVGPRTSGQGIANPRPQGMGQLSGRVASICAPGDLYCSIDKRSSPLLGGLDSILREPGWGRGQHRHRRRE